MKSQNIYRSSKNRTGLHAKFSIKINTRFPQCFVPLLVGDMYFFFCSYNLLHKQILLTKSINLIPKPPIHLKPYHIYFILLRSDNSTIVTIGDNSTIVTIGDNSTIVTIGDNSTIVTIGGSFPTPSWRAP